MRVKGLVRIAFTVPAEGIADTINELFEALEDGEISGEERGRLVDQVAETLDGALEFSGPVGSVLEQVDRALFQLVGNIVTDIELAKRKKREDPAVVYADAHTAAELRAEAKELDLETKGTKRALARRILDARG